jgi:hypothetical protein
MKSLFSCIVLLSLLTFKEKPAEPDTNKPIASAGNLFIITLDGFRWQEMFTGADPSLITNERFTPDSATINLLYGGDTPEDRREKLLPFFWNVISKKGQLYGNRHHGNKINTSNIYSISYPGYNEIFSGNTDITVSSNRKKRNHNINVLEYLNSREDFEGKVVAFTSWDVFPYILNQERSGIMINSGYNKNEDDAAATRPSMVDHVQQLVNDESATRHDQLTFLTAKEFLEKHHPRVLYLGLGETDEAAHSGRYDLYLEKAKEADGIIAALWHWAQTTPGYKDNTTFIITTDHGRGGSRDRWMDHGTFVNGASQTWLAVLGPAIEALGELKTSQQLYQKQIAQTIANLLGEDFQANQSIADRISLR